MSIYGVLLVGIFSVSLFSINVGKCGPKKLRIWTIFTHCYASLVSNDTLFWSHNVECIFITYSNIYDAAFSNNFPKKLYCRCLSGFWIRLCNECLINNFSQIIFPQDIQENSGIILERRYFSLNPLQRFINIRISV